MGHNAQHKYNAANLNSVSSPVIKINSQPSLLVILRICTPLCITFFLAFFVSCLISTNILNFFCRSDSNLTSTKIIVADSTYYTRRFTATRKSFIYSFYDSVHNFVQQQRCIIYFVIYFLLNTHYQIIQNARIAKFHALSFICL